MMSYLKNERGVALAMVLVLSLISIALVTALIFMATQRTQLSGALRFFRTAEEAGIGGAEFAGEYVRNFGQFNVTGGAITYITGPYAAGCDCNDPDLTTDNLDNSVLPFPARTCRCDKLCESTADWPFAGGFSCDDNGGLAGLQVDLRPSLNPDMEYTLGIDPITFDVSVKIVDSAQGNSDVGGIVPPGGGQVGGAGVVASNSGLISPPHNPYLYRIEIEAEASNNPSERSRVSVLFAH